MEYPLSLHAIRPSSCWSSFALDSITFPHSRKSKPSNKPGVRAKEHAHAYQYPALGKQAKSQPRPIGPLERIAVSLKFIQTN
jgi:hypothetical protein